MADREPFGTSEAEALLSAGWGQGAVFSPNEHIPLPSSCAVWPENYLLIVCTQSCGVVSPSLDRDPLVELAMAHPVTTYSPRSTEATGRHGRIFHVAVDGALFEALAVDINSRFFVPRQVLLQTVLNDVSVKPNGIRDLAGWLGRHYTRIALPNELVRRLEPTLFKSLKKHLSEAIGVASGSDSLPRVHEAVGAIYVRWTPDIELNDAGHSYVVVLLILCDDAKIADELDRRLSSIGGVEAGVTYEVTVQARGETVLSDLDGFVRLTEYDYLTGMGNVSQLPG